MIVTLVLVLSIAAAVGGQIINVSDVLAVQDIEGHCYPRLGCFEGGPPYYGTLERPIGFPPWSPERIDVRFLLLTRNNTDQYQVIRAINIDLTQNDTQIKGTNFDPNLKTIMIAHGFGEKGDKWWLVEMCQAFLNVSNVNCFCVDWSNGSLALYTQASNNVRVVGAEMANFLRFLQVTYNYSMDNVILIGHSLGGHVVGEAGKRQQGIAVIIGLDPAGPYFENASPSVRLAPTDARFVMVIHTDGPPDALHLGFGMKQRVGHFDIFPNGGENMPGCQKIFVHLESIDALATGLYETIFCNHQMSFRYFIKSILRPDAFVSYPASSYSAFQKGSGFPCTNGSCAYWGYKVTEYASSHGQNDTISQMFFLTTGDPSNFMRWRYQISISITGGKSLMGSLSVSLCGKVGCSNYSLIHSGLLDSGQNYSSFIDVEKDVNPVQKVLFVWQKSDLSLLPAGKVGASAITVQYGPTGETYKFCGGDPTEEDATQTLEKCPSTDPL